MKISFPAAALDDTEWAGRCAYWLQLPTEKRGLGTPIRRQVHKPLILTGHGMGLRIDHGALAVRNGFTHYPQRAEEHRFFPGDRMMPSRIIVIDGSGNLSFDVLIWLARQRVPLIKIDWRGNVVTVLGANFAPDPKLVARQSAAKQSSKAVEFAIALVREKIENSMLTLAHTLPLSTSQEHAIGKLKREIESLNHKRPKSIAELLGIEGKVAKTYFDCWKGLPLRWKGTGRHPIPADWHKIGPRQSALGGKLGKNKRASHPMNAMLNYAYAILESQIRIDIVAKGYDPTIGFLHSSQPDRPAFVLDLMEPLRPVIDRRVLEFVQAHTFHPADFIIRSDGVCRLNPEMGRQVVCVSLDCLKALPLSPELPRRPLSQN